MFNARILIGKHVLHRTAKISSVITGHAGKTVIARTSSTGVESPITGPEAPVNTDAAKTGGFAKAYEKQSQIVDTKEPVENHTFASLLRRSKLMDVCISNYLLDHKANCVYNTYLCSTSKL